MCCGNKPADDGRPNDSNSGQNPCQINERDAFRALFSFGGTLTGLDSAQVSNIKAATLNARAFAAEIIAMLKRPTAQPRVRAEVA
jgi:hypothetical protein